MMRLSERPVGNLARSVSAKDVGRERRNIAMDFKRYGGSSSASA